MKNFAIVKKCETASTRGNFHFSVARRRISGSDCLRQRLPPLQRQPGAPTRRIRLKSGPGFCPVLARHSGSRLNLAGFLNDYFWSLPFPAALPPCLSLPVTKGLFVSWLSGALVDTGCRDPQRDQVGASVSYCVLVTVRRQQTALYLS